MGRGLLTVGLVALTVRLAYLAQIASAPFSHLRLGDGDAYHRWARDIAAGDWYGQDPFFQAPLYPYLLALVYRVVGDGAAMVRFVHAVLGTGSCVLLAAAGVELFGPIGLVAGALLAVYAPGIFLDGLLDKNALTTFLVCGLLYVLARRKLGHRSLVAGVILGLLTLTRENAVLLAFPAMAWLVIGPGPSAELPGPVVARSRALRTIGAGLAGFAAVVAPVAIRNVAVGGDFVVTTTNFGSNLYIGNHPGAQGLYEPLVPGHGSAATERDDARRLAEAAMGRTLTDREVSRFWTSRALAFVREQPLAWLGQMARKLALTFNAAEPGDTESFQVYAEWSSVLRRLSPFGFGAIFAFAAFGLGMLGRDWRRAWFVPAIVVTYTLSVIAFFLFARFRFPLVPALLLMGTGGLAAWGDAAKRSRRPWALAAAVVAAGGALIPLGSTGTDRVTHYVNVANALAADPSRLDLAVDFYGRVLGESPRSPAAHFGLGALAMRAGRFTQAAEHLRVAIDGWPDNADLRVTAAMLFAQIGDNERARSELATAESLQPFQPIGDMVRGRIALNEGRAQDALDAYRRQLARAPADVDSLMGAARALDTLDRTDEALALYRRVLEVEAGHAGAIAALAATGAGRQP